MKLFSLLVTSLLFPHLISSQNLAWVNTYGNSGADRIFRITLAPNNDIITTGQFENTVDFNPSTSVNNSTSNGNDDIAICRYDENGNFQWVKSFGGTGIDRGLAVTTDKHGNIYGTGYFSGTVDFNPGTTTNNLTSNGNVDAYLVKLDSAGNYIWAKSFGSTNEDMGWDIKVDGNDEVILTGYFRGTVDFDPGTGTTNRTSNGADDIFILKLDSSGSFKWVNTYGSSGSTEIGYSIDVDANDNIYLTGSFSGRVDFDPSSSTYNLTSSGQTDAFLTKISTSGTFLWAKKWGAAYEDIAISLTISTKGNIYIGGLFRGTVDFDPGSGISSHTSNGSRDVFTMKLDSSGGFLWAKTIGSSSADVVSELTVDQYENISFTGYFYGTMDCDPSSSTYNLSNSGGSDSYVCQFDKNGDFNWAYAIGSNGNDISNGIVSDLKSILYISGSFSNSNVDFDPQSSTSTKSSNGDYDAFVQKILDCKNSYDTLFEIACNTYTSPSGKYTWTQNGTYNDTLISYFGCDSILQINLFITNSEATLNPTVCTSYISPSGSHTWDSTGTYYDTIPGVSACDSLFIVNLTVLQIDTSFTVLACKNYTSPSGKTSWKTSGIYQDTVPSSQGCDSVMTILLALIQPDTTITANDPILRSNATGNISYQWLDCNNGYAKLTGETSRTFTATFNGRFAVEVNNSACKDTSVCYQILTIGLNDISRNDKIFTIHPNPNNGLFTIQLSNEYKTVPIQYNLIDIRGKTLKSESITDSKTLIDCTDLSKGIYFLQLNYTNGEKKVKKFIIN